MKKFRLRIQKEINLTGLKMADSQFNQYITGKVKKGNKTPQQQLDIEDDGMEPLGGKPMRLMDLLKGEDLYAKEDEDHGDENDK